jgi:hypothetical protein
MNCYNKGMYDLSYLLPRQSVRLSVLSIFISFFLTACGGGGGSDDAPEPVILPPENKSTDVTVMVVTENTFFEINEAGQSFLVKFVFSEPINGFHPAEATVKNASFRSGSVKLSEYSTEFEISVTPNDSGKDIEIYVRASVGGNRNGKDNLVSNTLIIRAVDTIPPQMSLTSELLTYNTLGDVQDITLQIHSNEPITAIDEEDIILTHSTLKSIEEINSNNYQVIVTPDGSGNNVSLTVLPSTVSDLSGIKNSISAAITFVAEEQKPLRAAQAELKFNFKKFIFQWQGVPDATHYNIIEQVNGENYTSLAENLVSDTNIFSIAVSLIEKIDAKYIVQSCNALGCTDDVILHSGNMVRAIGYIKTNENLALQYAGRSISINADGAVMAVGAPGSLYTTFSGSTIKDEWIPGAVYLYRKMDGVWQQEQKIQAPEPENNDGFGHSVSLSANGELLAIGSYKENSSSTGVNSDANNNRHQAGAVYIFKNTNAIWEQNAYIKPSYTYQDQLFGKTTKLSADGSTLIVGAPGIALEFVDRSKNPIEAVYVFKREGNSWYQQERIFDSSVGINANFGDAIAINSDGTLLIVGAPYRDYPSADDSIIRDTGIVFSYQLDEEGNWLKTHTFTTPSLIKDYEFGASLTLSGDGSRVAIGSFKFYANNGAINIFDRAGSNWELNTSIKANSSLGDNPFILFSSDMAFNHDGTLLVVGTPAQRGLTEGVNRSPEQAVENINTGAAYVYTFLNDSWDASAFLKSANIDYSGRFGSAISVSADGKTIAIGDADDDFPLVGFQSNLTETENEPVQASGAVHLF